MKKVKRKVSIFFLFCFLFNIVFSFTAVSCKDIIAVNEATDGNYNLLMKIRDPSRLGPQVISIAPYGYEYSFPNPWTGKEINYKVNEKFIFIGTKGDTIPNIMKPAMALSESGIAYGDADTYSGWYNPTEYAWDDFDWIRYACQTAENEDEAVYLSVDAVKRLHAPANSENIFIVGPDISYIVEGDSVHTYVEKVDSFAVRQNYPKELWKNQPKRRVLFSPFLDKIVERWIIKGGVIRLGGFFGVKVLDITDSSIIVKPFPFDYSKRGTKSSVNFKNYEKVNLSESKTIGDWGSWGGLRLTLLKIKNNFVKIKLCTDFYAWEEKMNEIIQEKNGEITVKDMMNWSRLHTWDLDGLRGMCAEKNGKKYRPVAIYKIPQKNFETLSCGWFTLNRPCSSVFVPFHICDNDFFESYKSGESSELSLDLLNSFGHDYLNEFFEKTEDVFMNENLYMEKIALDLIKKRVNFSDFLTISDMSMQRQAYLTEKIWQDLKETDNKEIIGIIGNIWQDNYSNTLKNMFESILKLENFTDTKNIIKKIIEISLDICQSRINAAESIGKEVEYAQENFNEGSDLIKKGNYESGFNYITEAFTESNSLLIGAEYIPVKTIDSGKDKNIEIHFGVFVILIIIAILVVLLYKKNK